MAVPVIHITTSLLADLKAGNESALKKILELYGPKLLNYCKKQGIGVSDAEELLQDVFIKLWQFRENLDLSTNFEAFLFTITRNALLNFVRKQIGYELTASGNLEETAPAYAAWDIHRMGYMEVYQQYLQVLKGVDDKRREAFRLSREEGLSHRQIAAQLNISVRTVEFYISGMLKLLRTELKDSYILLVLFLFR
ncbi:RNA polymerase sigma factor [Chitinophaga solisilvae]|uniref:Sigma-70 family RNA polymerase sigma factor n=1 Tax=Chitinophaga solisilvae TaxID=1233460 RepID=A0A3S1B2Z5_9BACT|nr:sigma-70 family RNA polymerase sigma factor [Chitinophaga solisilvae]NSL88659.1 sigma-70 family RNA polymerase sigma factor [Chitinophaga solisilvae]